MKYFNQNNSVFYILFYFPKSSDLGKNEKILPKGYKESILVNLSKLLYMSRSGTIVRIDIGL